MVRTLTCNLGNYRAVIVYCKDGKMEEKAGVCREKTASRQMGEAET